LYISVKLLKYLIEFNNFIVNQITEVDIYKSTLIYMAYDYSKINFLSANDNI